MTVEGNWLSDTDIRLALLPQLRVMYAAEPQTIFIEELGICQGRARIDIAVINGVIHGYEIKSDRDSLRRLSGQVEIYSKVVDRATIVVGNRHLAEALASVPDWWGVLQIEETSRRVSFKPIRKGHNNPQIEARSLVELLWLDDAINLLTQRGAARGIRSKPRRMAWDRICERLALDEIAEAVRARLRARVMLQGPVQPS